MAALPVPLSCRVDESLPGLGLTSSTDGVLGVWAKSIVEMVEVEAVDLLLIESLAVDNLLLEKVEKDLAVDCLSADVPGLGLTASGSPSHLVFTLGTPSGIFWWDMAAKDIEPFASACLCCCLA